jgi:hypothetical protein
MDIKPFWSNVPDSIVDYKLKTLWLRNWKDLHLYKETCLYNDFDYFISQFETNVPVILATRSWLEILLSFQKSNLFQRWGYDGIYELIRNSIKNSSLLEIFDTYYDLDISEEDKLTTLMLINSFFIAQWIIDNSWFRRKISFPSDKITILSHFSESAEYLWFDLEQTEPNADDEAFIDEAKILDTTFLTTTRIKHWLVLPERTFYELKAKIQSILDLVWSQFGTKYMDIMKDLIHFDENQISPHGIWAKKLVTLENNNRFHVKRLPAPSIQSDWFYSSEYKMNISNILTTNIAYVDFLNDLFENWWNEMFNWLSLLINYHMPEARWGRIYYDAANSTFAVREGFENYPVYWISWLWSFLYCYAKSFKLPSLEIAQWISEISAQESNIWERFWDATPVWYFLPNIETPIYDSNWNLMIFTDTKKDIYPSTFMASWFSWKDSERREQSRFIWETSRRIGFRSIKYHWSEHPETFQQRLGEITSFFNSISYDWLQGNQVESKILEFISLISE